MSSGIDLYMEQLVSKDDGERYNALQEMLKITEQEVPWFEQYKDILISMLKNENSYHRSIAAMLLSNLAKNDKGHSEYKKILPLMMKLIDDEKFITQRQYIQCIWKVALVDKNYKEIIVSQLKNEFQKCISKKHYNLIQLDVISSLGKIIKETDDGKLREAVIELIESETDTKNKKKYKDALR
jgi:hypothetical protein